MKRFYARTNKNRAVRQMTLLERRETALMQIAARAQKNARAVLGKTTATPVAQGHKRKLQKNKMYVPFHEDEALPYTAPDQHHHISQSHNFSFHISSWLGQNLDDPATSVSAQQLKDLRC